VFCIISYAYEVPDFRTKKKNAMYEVPFARIRYDKLYETRSILYIFCGYLSVLTTYDVYLIAICVEMGDNIFNMTINLYCTYSSKFIVCGNL